jgi:hypothetical protein
MSGAVDEIQSRAEAERLRAEAAADRKAAEEALAKAEYERGQADHRRREIAEIEKSVAKREAALKAAGEPEFLARQAAAEKALADAQALMKQYNADWHAGAIAFQQINEREKAALGAA